MKTTIQIPLRFIDATAKDGVADAMRQPLAAIYVDVERRKLVACCGSLLVTLDIPGEEPVQPGFITQENWAAAKARLPKAKTMAYDYARGTVNGVAHAGTDAFPLPYPPYARIWPEGPACFQVQLDPRLVTLAATAMAAAPATAGKSMTFEFFPGESPAAVIRYAGATGAVHCSSGPAAGAPAGQPATAPLPERSDHAATAQDHAMIEALRSEMLQARARVTELEAVIAAGAQAARPPGKPPKEKREAPLALGPPTLTRNAEKNGIELRFDGKPDDESRARMKAAGFRWAPGIPGQPWLVRYSEEAWVLATALAEGQGAAAAPQPPPARHAPAPAPLPPPPAGGIIIPDF